VLDRARVGRIGQKNWTNLDLLGAASVRHALGVTLFGYVLSTMFSKMVSLGRVKSLSFLL
jgi:hypothetical protein